MASGALVDFVENIKVFDYVSITPFSTNREANENKIEYELMKLGIDEKSIVMVHCPPYMAQDKIHSGANVGSKSARKCIESFRPKIWFCGHIHEDFGVSRIGTTLVVNCACDHTKSALKYVIVDSDSMEYIISIGR